MTGRLLLSFFLTRGLAFMPDLLLNERRGFQHFTLSHPRPYFMHHSHSGAESNEREAARRADTTTTDIVRLLTLAATQSVNDATDEALRRNLRRLALKRSGTTSVVEQLTMNDEWRSAPRPLAIHLADSGSEGGEGFWSIDVHVLPSGTTLPLPRLSGGMAILTRCVYGVVEAKEARSAASAMSDAYTYSAPEAAIQNTTSKRIVNPTTIAPTTTTTTTTRIASSTGDHAQVYCHRGSNSGRTYGFELNWAPPPIPESGIVDHTTAATVLIELFWRWGDRYDLPDIGGSPWNHRMAKGGVRLGLPLDKVLASVSDDNPTPITTTSGVVADGDDKNDDVLKDFFPAETPKRSDGAIPITKFGKVAKVGDRAQVTLGAPVIKPIKETTVSSTATGGDGGISLPSKTRAARKSLKTLPPPPTSRRRFQRMLSSVAGLNEELEDIRRRIWLPLASPPELLHELGISPPRGLLLHGPPGCGKSTVARDLARCLSPRPPTLISGPEIMEMFVGASEANVRGIFEKPPEVPIAALERHRQWERSEALSRGSDFFEGEFEPTDLEATALHVVIFDEFDAIAAARGGGAAASSPSGSAAMRGEASRAADMVVNQLLATIDGVNDGSVYTSVDGSDFVQNVVAGEGTMSMYVDPDAWNNDFDYNGNLCNRDEEARVASSKHKTPQRDALGRSGDAAQDWARSDSMFPEVRSADIDETCTESPGVYESADSNGRDVVGSGGPNKRPPFLVIGLTNRKDLIDPALLRPGRLEVHVELKEPDEEARRDIFALHCSTMRRNGRLDVGDFDEDVCGETSHPQNGAKDAMNSSSSMHGSNRLYNRWLRYMANRTPGMSGADISGLVRAAASRALRRGHDQAEMDGTWGLDGTAGESTPGALAACRVTSRDFSDALEDTRSPIGLGEEVSKGDERVKGNKVTSGDKDDCTEGHELPSSSKTPSRTSAPLLGTPSHTVIDGSGNSGAGRVENLSTETATTDMEKKKDPRRVAAVTEALSDVKARMEATGWKHWTGSTVRRAVAVEAEEYEADMRRHEEEQKAEEVERVLTDPTELSSSERGARSPVDETLPMKSGLAGFAGVVERLRQQEQHEGRDGVD